MNDDNDATTPLPAEPGRAADDATLAIPPAGGNGGPSPRDTGGDSRGGRRWVLPVAIGAVVLALVGGVGLGVALTGGETEETSPTASTSSTVDSTNSGGGGGSTGSDTGSRTTDSGGGSGTSTSQPTPPPASPTPALPKPEFTSVTVRDVECGGTGSEVNVLVGWKTTNATSVDLKGGNYPPNHDAASFTYRCGQDPPRFTLVAHGPGGDTTKTVVFDVFFK